MKLYINTTSPFVRLVRLAIAEKGLAGRVETEIVDPWGDAEPFLRANAAARVPTLVTDDGTPIAEALLILRYLDAIAPEPSVWPARDLERTLTVAAVALGAIEAATSIIIGRKSSPTFDSDAVGIKRHRTMREGLRRLDAMPPLDFADRPDIAGYAAVTVVDYIGFRFPDRDWLADLPTLSAWRERQQQRESVASTQPYA
ncbi:glutathione S-transferase family protein [Thalassobaculum salexigens]|uniref:glutathione S-transferase family protein n=1 Tax=Thalassobaculum salexigens TaxID=455360 RepID=UPI00248F0BDA|nr:glutathione S-transferase family protein [Thalassobaculum salexigens]